MTEKNEVPEKVNHPTGYWTKEALKIEDAKKKWRGQREEK